MIIADSNILSELMRRQPDPMVVAWAAGVGPGDLAITAITVQEIQYGLGRLPAGKRRAELTARWEAVLEPFADFVAAYGADAAVATARILVESDARGRPMELADAQIAGICATLDASLATRNVEDFTHVPRLTLINPFDQDEKN
ncbi:type II toxin-antitoxin system VapC family toxin [Ammonicoccus fulvus]|uniref:Ribonuclease VapC n=1 Tax=Ammonicoccus fulvus TaxID=3138240 RepID=A0ABZ3FS88_9ACTN